MRLIVTSDTHRSSRNFFNIVERHKDNKDVLFINLGDSEAEVEDFKMFYPKLRLENAVGNCDWSNTYPVYKMLKCSSKKVLITHGHKFYVKHGYQKLEEFARQEGADIVLFGHTHIPYVEILNQAE